ncbi:hypothetical protein XENORESO_020493 [Xenotaenia resolanae]|uniref:Uncharacterized protein n=1 Tax=Xenotaenia resolanae TaxID=208358 RepID=A0ABV0W9T5_9TELE
MLTVRQCLTCLRRRPVCVSRSVWVFIRGSSALCEYSRGFSVFYVCRSDGRGCVSAGARGNKVTVSSRRAGGRSELRAGNMVVADLFRRAAWRGRSGQEAAGIRSVCRSLDQKQGHVL